MPCSVVRTTLRALCTHGFQSTIMISAGRQNTTMQFCGSTTFYFPAYGAPRFKQGRCIQPFLLGGLQFQQLVRTDPIFSCTRSGGILASSSLALKLKRRVVGRYPEALPWRGTFRHTGGHKKVNWRSQLALRLRDTASVPQNRVWLYLLLLCFELDGFASKRIARRA